MNRGQRTIATLLAVVAVLLAANLAVSLPGQEAQAGHRRVPDIASAPRLVGISVFGGSKIIRLWSDGVVEERQALITGPCCPNLHWEGTYPEWFEIVP